MSRYNIIALIKIEENVETPKTGGIKSGYAPHHRFKGVDYLVSGFHEYSDNFIHYPGEIISARITFPSWEYFKNSVNVGDRFEILEMNRLIGCGLVEVIEEDENFSGT
ncbi:hypothetical protein [Delftia tsuruhatensis]|uniref:hypothetical protein n=1 Tax=Delftia tsuruhatensis TaxID=180282 RepID=UPI001F1C3998|nr:hypothetical protein [Delftia tsuruhatensis]